MNILTHLMLLLLILIYCTTTFAQDAKKENTKQAIDEKVLLAKQIQIIKSVIGTKSSENKKEAPANP